MNTLMFDRRKLPQFRNIHHVVTCSTHHKKMHFLVVSTYMWAIWVIAFNHTGLPITVIMLWAGIVNSNIGVAETTKQEIRQLQAFKRQLKIENALVSSDRALHPLCHGNYLSLQYFQLEILSNCRFT